MPTVVERFQYPTVTEMKELDPIEVQAVAETEPVFRYFPIRASNYVDLSWHVRDTVMGIQHGRTFNEPFPRVKRPGGREFAVRPGLYGEHINVEERELTNRALLAANASRPIDVSDIVVEAQRITLQRQVLRQAKSCWDVAQTGRFVATDEFGTRLDEYYFDVITVDASDWSNLSTGTPLKDMIDLMQTNLGTRVNLSGASAYCTSLTASWAMLNTNAADMGGKRAADQSTITALSDVNRIFSQSGLPQLVTHDGGYWDGDQDDPETYAFNKFLTDGNVVIFGMVPGMEVGEYRLTRNGNNPDGSSTPYYKVTDSAMNPQAPPPRQINIYRGHNGGPLVWYPSAIIVMKVGP
jgi:hypothetical protein